MILYLVKREQLPEEIRNQIGGQDNLESRDYRKLKGVYGITSDLQAYYCEDGIESIVGLEIEELNADSPEIVAFDQNSALASIINGGTDTITNRDLKNIKTLTIDDISELPVLQDFSQFTNLNAVYFQNITIANLDGIEGAVTTLNYVKFTNCNVADYSALNGLTNLTYLYLVRPVGTDTEVEILCSTDKGIANANFSKLEYFGIVGDDSYIQSTTTDYASTRYGITNISSFANLSDTTKKAIKYLYLQNLQITSIAALEDFSNVYIMRLEENALTTFEGIQNMNNLTYLIAPTQYSDVEANYTLGINEGDTASTTDALSYIYKNNNVNSKLYYVDLRNNSNLKFVDSLSECPEIRYLYLANCKSIVNASTITTVLGNCGINYSIAGECGLDIISDNIQVLSLSGKTLTISEFEQLKNKTNITHLSLSSMTLTTDDGIVLTNETTPTFNETVNEVLSTCTNLTNLQLNGLTNLTTIDFISSEKCTKLVELDLRNTGVTDLVSLNTYAVELKTIIINNDLIDITTIQTTINRCTGEENYWNGTYKGACLLNWNLIKQLEECTELTYYYSYYDVSKITNGKVLDLSNTKLETINITWYWCTITYPSTVKNFWNDWCKVPIFSEKTENLEDLTLKWNRVLSTEEEWQICMQSIANLVNLKSFYVTNAQNFKFEYLEYLKDLQYLETFIYEVRGNSMAFDTNKTSLTGIGYLKNLKTLQIISLENITDISDIAGCVNLTNLLITNGKVSDISALAGLTKLETIDLSTNSINNIYALKNLINLRELNLQNNILNNFAYYRNESGQSIAYEVMDIFYDLNNGKKGSLESLYIDGNNFDDTDILLDLTWTEKSGF